MFAFGGKEKKVWVHLGERGRERDKKKCVYIGEEKRGYCINGVCIFILC